MESLRVAVHKGSRPGRLTMWNLYKLSVCVCVGQLLGGNHVESLKYIVWRWWCSVYTLDKTGVIYIGEPHQLRGCFVVYALLIGCNTRKLVYHLFAHMYPLICVEYDC